MSDDTGTDAGHDLPFPPLGGPPALDREVTGGKASALSALLAAGFPVPPGFVITRAAMLDGRGRDDWAMRLQAAARAAGPGPYAVRSSAAAEDLPGASYAGMYDSYLGVDADGLASAVTRCFESAESDRVLAYQESHENNDAGKMPGTGGMAVLVQQMVDAAAAGVAFTANPLTGARDETVVSAVVGLGENLVGGSESGEEWLARGGLVSRRRGAKAVLTKESATTVAAAARDVATHFGTPQDVEWALDASGHVHILQARPMTAVPEPVMWEPPGKGVWLRNFRLGEWLPEPVTPLFMDWIVPLIDTGYHQAVTRSAGISIPMGHAAVNGWYYLAPPGPMALPHLLFGGSLRPLPYIFNSVLRPMVDPAGADRAVLRSLEHEWRNVCLTRYRELAGAQGIDVGTADLPQLTYVVEQVARAAGEYLWYFSAAGGAAWKMEAVLARFWRRHLAAALAEGQRDAPETEGYQVLLGGLLPTLPAQVPHAVFSLDWYHPTAGEEQQGQGKGVGVGRGEGAPAAPARAMERRHAAEAACRKVLRGTRHLRRFDTLLAVAQHYARLREDQARDFTLGWPLLRRCAARMGMLLQQSGVIASPDDVHFLTRADLRTGAPAQHAVVGQRRQEWLRQRKLDAPLTLGTLPILGNAFDRLADAARSTRTAPPGSLRGHPASPGRARGHVRIVDGPADFSDFQPGEVLVAKATAPAWTPLFASAAAVVTDTGNLAAHASLVAREYGIPAVVGTGNATRLLHTGQLVTVDGNAGTIELHED
ncbi:PEP/pyruvate-binding domain-containing protein [Arthrobacter sp. W4I7]|uniref:PEP/pyruvate-binding domain-containing protein n=1 Tax=Arthrobacter sp. W4I7 TaxID=3042296 RepID=UPI00277F45B4|nr:PEP/pyruvate-binding domain-containing protein [Arthrobacter sp. W4I7]MDQ0690837.1 phosphohistidine swiveling domain-containing protein [Arthrobacter sp. W4I7]